MEWILISIAIIVIFIITQFLKKQLGATLKPKTRLLFSFLWFIIFMIYIFYINAGKNHFTFFQQFIMIAFVVGYLISFYLRYKKLNQANNSAIQP